MITGLIVVIPVFLSIYALVAGFRLIDGILGRFLNQREFYVPGLGFLLLFFVIILTGFLATRFLGKRIYPRIEKWFACLPLINKIYPTLKQIVLFVLAQKEFGFKKVVLAEYPCKGIWSLGFITNDNFKKISQVAGRETVAVFIPSSPGPLTGYVTFIPKADLRFPDISISDALKIIISGGVFSLGKNEGLPL